MLPRVAAFCACRIIVVWPAVAGSDTDTFWSSPSAAVLAAMPAPALDPAQQQVADAAEAVPPEQAIGEDNAPMHETPRTDVPARTAAGDAAETKIPPPPTLPPALRARAHAARTRPTPPSPTAKATRKAEVIGAPTKRRRRRHSSRRSRRPRTATGVGAIRPCRDAGLVRKDFDKVARRRGQNSRRQ